MAFVMPLTFSAWSALINNFSVEAANFTGKEIGILHTIRELPGFLAFTAVLFFPFIREQKLAIVALLIFTGGVLITGYFPSIIGLYTTTLLMSLGFHYYETIHQSLTLQWVSKAEAPHFLGQALAVKAAASIVVFASIWLLLEYAKLSYRALYGLFGGAGLLITIFIAYAFPIFPIHNSQNKTLFLRKRYWLYYALTFLSGARRQIFMVFAGFLLVEKFGYSAAAISLLFLVNYVFNLCFAAQIGKWIGVIGERRALTVEYIGLIAVFISYALTKNAQIAGALYLIDHFFFAFSIAIKTYFQKVANPSEIASTAAVSFTINHIAAVVLPAMLGLLWLQSPSSVFILGAVLAGMSLLLSQCIPDSPDIGNESRWLRSFTSSKNTVS